MDHCSERRWNSEQFFGRRRLGLAVGVDLLLRGVALGRVVRNEPRTSSSCWAYSQGRQEARECNQETKKEDLSSHSKLLLRTKYESQVTMGFILCWIEPQKQPESRNPLTGAPLRNERC